MKKAIKKKPQGATGRESDKFILRLPPGLREKIAALAATNGRSMNSEVVAALEKHVEADDSLTELYRLVEGLEQIVRSHSKDIDDIRRRDVT